MGFQASIAEEKKKYNWKEQTNESLLESYQEMLNMGIARERNIWFRRLCDELERRGLYNKTDNIAVVFKASTAPMDVVSLRSERKKLFEKLTNTNSSKMPEDLGILVKEQACPYTFVKVRYFDSQNGDTFTGKGFSKCMYPDIWDSFTGYHWAFRRAVLSICRQMYPIKE